MEALHLDPIGVDRYPDSEEQIKKTMQYQAMANAIAYQIQFVVAIVFPSYIFLFYTICHSCHYLALN